MCNQHLAEGNNKQSKAKCSYLRAPTLSIVQMETDAIAVEEKSR
jgi:hypothetical protein